MTNSEAKKQAIEKFGITAIVIDAWIERCEGHDSVMFLSEDNSLLQGNYSTGTIQNPDDTDIEIYRLRASEFSEVIAAAMEGGKYEGCDEDDIPKAVIDDAAIDYLVEKF